MKKTSLLLCVIVIISTIGFTASAKGGLELEVNQKLNTQNQTVQVEINATENPGFCYLKLNVEYDSSILKLTEAKNGTVTNGSFISNAKSLLWDSANDSKAIGQLAVLEFRIIKETNNNDYEITIHAVECYNISEEDINIIGLEKKESKSSETTKPLRKDEQQDKQNNSNEKLLEAIDLAVKENGYQTISDVKSDDNSFIEEVNKNIMSLKTTQKFKTVDEIVNTYCKVFTDNYVQMVANQCNQKQIDEVLQSALKKAGATSIEELTPEQKKIFVEVFENEMGKISGDIPVLSKKVDIQTAVEAIQKAVEHSLTEKPETGSFNNQLMWVLIGSGAIIIFVTTIIIFIVRKVKKQPETSGRENQKN